MTRIATAGTRGIVAKAQVSGTGRASAIHPGGGRIAFSARARIPSLPMWLKSVAAHLHDPGAHES
jgi:hypothetical protein